MLAELVQSILEHVHNLRYNSIDKYEQCITRVIITMCIKGHHNNVYPGSS